jgi:predicted TPR repeat methyltransferase
MTNKVDECERIFTRRDAGLAMASNTDDQENQQGAESETMSLEAALSLGVQTQREGRLKEAAYIYLQILAAVPDNVDALHLLGVAEHQAGRSESALKLIGRALALAPEHADALGNRGNVLQSLRRLDEAEADYRRALDLRPDDANTLSNLGTVLRARGDLEGAVALFRKVIAHKPDHAPAWQNLGGTLQTLERGPEALEAFREAARLAPDSADMFCDLGGALYAEGRSREAAEMYRRCLALAPQDARARHLLAACGGESVPARASDDYVRAEFDRYASTFDTSLARLEYRGPELVAQAVDEIVDALPPKPVVLDAGCGTGLCGPLVRAKAGSLVGVDLSSAMVALARERGVYDELVVGELTGYLRGHAQSCDVVVSADTLVYFGDLKDVLAAAATALRPDGALVFTLERAEPGDAPAGYRLNPHGRYSHTRDYVAGLLSAAGLIGPEIREISSRKESKQWVPGWLVRARRQASP